MEVQGHLWIFGKFKASLGYMTLYIFFFLKVNKITNVSHTCT